MTIDRHLFAEEMILREQIRKNIKTILKEETGKQKLFEQKLRSTIRDILEEQQSTSINLLEKLLSDTNVLSTMKDGYETLSSGEERESYKAHIFSALVRSFDIYDTNSEAEEVASDQDEMEEEITIDVEDEDEDEDLPLGLPEPEEDLEVKDTEAVTDFSLAGENQTGRNLALGVPGEQDKGVVDVVWPSIKNWYSKIGLEDTEGRELFRDYLMINLKKHFELWDDELNTDIEQPEIEEPEGSVETGSDLSDLDQSEDEAEEVPNLFE